MNVLDLVQGTPEWLAARAGKVTASRISDVCAKLASGKGEAATRSGYKWQIIAETLTGAPCEKGYSNKAMERGTLMEPLARVEYEILKDCSVEQVGFVIHPEITRAGASPDGLIGTNRGLELKCPDTTTHLKWISSGVVPAEHKPQMFWNMACTGRDEWDFGSYDDRVLDPKLQLFVVRLERDEKRILEITAEVIQFLQEVDEMIAKLQEVSRG